MSTNQTKESPKSSPRWASACAGVRCAGERQGERERERDGDGDGGGERRFRVACDFSDGALLLKATRRQRGSHAAM